MNAYSSEYKDYSGYAAVMISTDRSIFLENSPARARMIEHAKSYKELHIIIFSLKKFESVNISDRCIIYSTNSLSKLHYVSSARKKGKRILKKIDKTIPVLVTCQDPFETGLVGKCLAHARKNSELMLQLHTDLYSPYFVNLKIGFKNSFLNIIRLQLSKRALPQADVIRVVSKKIADSLVEKGIDASRIVVKPIDVDADAIRNREVSFDLHRKFPQFKKIIVMASRLEAEKNITMALGAMKIVHDRQPDAGLLIIGSGSMMSSLRKHAYRLKIEASTAFLGWQTDLLPYYKGCDLFLVTSWYEGYGMTLKEAQIAGCKIVSTDAGIAQEIGAEIAGWSVESIAESILRKL